jgi:hypothetical protein
MGRLLEIARAALAETEQAKSRGTDKELPIRMDAPTADRTKQAYAESEYRPCWHCGGSGECNCISCGSLEAHAVWKAGPCAPCKVRGRARVQ